MALKFHTPKESILWAKALWEHWRNSRMTREQLEAMQLRKFRKFVAWVQVRSPYYRKLIQQLGLKPESCVPSDFPLLTKRDVMEHFDEIVTDRQLTRQKVADFLARSVDPMERLDGKYHVLHTSGTSGVIGYYVFSHAAWIRGVSQVARASHLRLRKRVAFVAATRGHFAGVSLMLSGNEGTNSWFYDVRPYDVGQSLTDIVASLNAFQPQVLSGYAVMLKVLAEAQERGELRIKPQELGSGGEPLTPEMKTYIEKVFSAPVLNGYASSEHLYMAMTLTGRQGMHLLEDDLIFEFGDRYTAVTNLFNDTLPLIRYRMDDVLVEETSGTTDVPYRRIKEVVGRQENALVFTNALGQEDFIHPIVVAELVVPGMKAWQIILESRTAFRFKTVLEPGLNEDQREQALARISATLHGLLSEKSMQNVIFEIEEVNELPIDPRTGKFKLVVQQPIADKQSSLAESALAMLG